MGYWYNEVPFSSIKKKKQKTTGTQNNFVQTYMFQDKTTTSYFTWVVYSKDQITDSFSNSPSLQILTSLCPNCANFSLKPKLMGKFQKIFFLWIVFKANFSSSLFFKNHLLMQIRGLNSINSLSSLVYFCHWDVIF